MSIAYIKYKCVVCGKENESRCLRKEKEEIFDNSFIFRDLKRFYVVFDFLVFLLTLFYIDLKVF